MFKSKVEVLPIGKSEQQWCRINTECQAERQCPPLFIVFGMTRKGLDPTTFQSESLTDLPAAGLLSPESVGVRLTW